MHPRAARAPPAPPGRAWSRRLAPPDPFCAPAAACGHGEGGEQPLCVCSHSTARLGWAGGADPSARGFASPPDEAFCPLQPSSAGSRLRCPDLGLCSATRGGGFHGEAGTRLQPPCREAAPPQGAVRSGPAPPARRGPAAPPPEQKAKARGADPARRFLPALSRGSAGPRCLQQDEAVPRPPQQAEQHPQSSGPRFTPCFHLIPSFFPMSLPLGARLSQPPALLRGWRRQRAPRGEPGMSDQTGENPGERAESLESPRFDRFIPFFSSLPAS